MNRGISSICAAKNVGTRVSKIAIGRVSHTVSRTFVLGTSAKDSSCATSLESFATSINNSTCRSSTHTSCGCGHGRMGISHSSPVSQFSTSTSFPSQLSMIPNNLSTALRAIRGHSHVQSQQRSFTARASKTMEEILRTEPVRQLRPDEEDANIWHHTGEADDAAAAAVAASKELDVTFIGQIDPRIVIAFTCDNCSNRLVKTMSKKSYTQGVVLVRCDGCKANHLIADHLGWFDEHGVTIEDIMKEKGESVMKASGDSELPQEVLDALQSTMAKVSQADLDQPVGGIKADRARKELSASSSSATSSSATTVPEAELATSPSSSDQKPAS